MPVKPKLIVATWKDGGATFDFGHLTSRDTETMNAKKNPNVVSIQVKEIRYRD